MATAWQTLEEAALTLGISSRTLHRRLARGEFDTRMENGRREVLVIIPDPEPPADLAATAQVQEELSALAGRASALAAGVADVADTPVSYEPEQQADEVQQTMLALHEDRIRRTDLAIMAYQQSVNVTAATSRRAHRSARVAWGLAGGVVAAVFVAGIWATHTLTKASAEVDQLHQVVRQLSDTADTKGREADRLRQEAESVRLASAKLEGELSATKSQLGQLLQAQATAAAARQTGNGPTAPPPTNAQSSNGAADSAVSPATQPSANRPQASAMDALMQRITLQ